MRLIVIRRGTCRPNTIETFCVRPVIVAAINQLCCEENPCGLFVMLSGIDQMQRLMAVRNGTDVMAVNNIDSATPTGEATKSVGRKLTTIYPRLVLV